MRLPPYSPDFNPIEMAISKIKTLLRKLAKRDLGSLFDAVSQAMKSITPQTPVPTCDTASIPLHSNAKCSNVTALKIDLAQAAKMNITADISYRYIFMGCWWPERAVRDW